MTTGVPPRGDRLPIKVILPNQGKERPNHGGGSKPIPFTPVTTELRASLNTQIGAIQRGLADQIGRVGAAPIRVQLIGKALAKSHRPAKLFNERTCPIVGAGSHGELFVKATPQGLANLKKEIESNEADRIKKDISTIQAIEAVTPLQRRKRKTAREVLQSSPRFRDEFFLTRVRLFDFGPSEEQESLIHDFEAVCAEKSLIISTQGYGDQSKIYSVACRNESDIETLSKTVGVRSIIGMPLLRTIRANAFNHAPIPSNLPVQADVEGDFPSVVVADSGVNPQMTPLESWVSGRVSSVAPEYRNPTHGTFVAGLIIWGDRYPRPSASGEQTVH